MYMYVCTELFELIFLTDGPAPVTGMCKLAYIDDVILVGHGVSAE